MSMTGMLFAGMYRAALLALTPALVRIELFEKRRQILDDALQLHFRAIDQLMAVRTVPLKSIERALGAGHFNDHSDRVSRPLWGMAHVFRQEKNVAFFDLHFQRRLARRLHDAQRNIPFQLVE